MNFAFAKKICSEMVLNHLKQITGRESTTAFLKIINLIKSGLLEESTNLFTKIYNIWYVRFSSEFGKH